MLTSFHSRPVSRITDTNSHNVVERRYRASLNNKFRELQSCLSESRVILAALPIEDQEMLRSLSVGDSLDSCSNASGAPRQSKSVVLEIAINSINILRQKCKRSTAEISLLETRIQALTAQMSIMLD